MTPDLPLWTAAATFCAPAKALKHAEAPQPRLAGETLPAGILARARAAAVRLADCGLQFTFTANREGLPCVWAKLEDGDRMALDARPANWGALATRMQREGVLREVRRVKTKSRRKVTLWERRP